MNRSAEDVPVRLDLEGSVAGEVPQRAGFDKSGFAHGGQTPEHRLGVTRLSAATCQADCPTRGPRLLRGALDLERQPGSLQRRSYRDSSPRGRGGRGSTGCGRGRRTACVSLPREPAERRRREPASRGPWARYAASRSRSTG